MKTRSVATAQRVPAPRNAWEKRGRPLVARARSAPLSSGWVRHPEVEGLTPPGGPDLAFEVPGAHPLIVAVAEAVEDVLDQTRCAKLDPPDPARPEVLKYRLTGERGALGILVFRDEASFHLIPTHLAQRGGSLSIKPGNSVDYFAVELTHPRDQEQIGPDDTTLRLETIRRGEPGLTRGSLIVKPSSRFWLSPTFGQSNPLPTRIIAGYRLNPEGKGVVNAEVFPSTDRVRDPGERQTVIWDPTAVAA